MIGNASVAKVSILDNESDGNVNAEWKLDEEKDGAWTVAVWVKRGQTTDDNAVLLNGTQGEIKLEQYPNTKKVE